MKDTFSKKVTTYLKTQHHDLQFVFAKIKVLTELNQKIMRYLDPTLRKHSQVANVADNQLTFLVTNSSIATQIRLLSFDLLDKFKQEPSLSHIKKIHCIVNPPQAKKAVPVPAKVNPISPETAQIIADIASSIEDPKLREIMKKIAEKAKKS